MKYIINTLGCKVNQYETQAIETLLNERGHEVCTTKGMADVVMVNSCAVTAESGRKSRQALRKLKNENPSAITVICGCWSQTDTEAAKELGADIVYGSGDRLLMVDEIEKALGTHENVVHIDKPFERRMFEELPAGAFAEHARAYLKIEDGCVNFCTYCIIPFARGSVRSLPLEKCVEEAVALEKKGYREIVITGIEIASYGNDFGKTVNLTDVVCAVANSLTDCRIRLGSLEPTVIDEDFCKRLSETGKVCPHFHLSLQSGSDGVLKRMNRKYDTARFMEAVVLLRKYFPDCALTADLIAGFPAETETEHEETLKFIEECGFFAIHAFPYSRRAGTKADKMDGQLTQKVKSERVSDISKLAKKLKMDYLSACVGKILPVLFETEKDGMSIGHADNYVQVSAKGEQLRSFVRNVKIREVFDEMLVGDIV